MRKSPGKTELFQRVLKRNKTKNPTKPPQALVCIKPSASSFCKPQPRPLMVELGVPLWDHRMRLTLTLHSNFKFCFQFILTSYFLKSIHERYTLALKGEYALHIQRDILGQGMGETRSGQCSDALLLQVPMPNLEVQGSSVTSNCCFFMTGLYDSIGLFWIKPC